MIANAAESTAERPSRRSALVAAAAFAVLGFAIAFLSMRRTDQPGDFLYWYTAARKLLQGESPYVGFMATDPARLVTDFFYPLPAALVTVPLAPLRYALAGGLFVGISSGLLAYGIAQSGVHRLWLFASAAYIVSAASGTWSIPLAAAAVVPALGFLVIAKPNVGIAAFLFRPTRWMVIGSALLLGASILVRPSWPGEWFGVLGGVQNRVIPILTPAGPLILACATRWRRPEARLLLGYACIPQAPWFYDQVILWLIPATALQAMNYVVISQVALAIWLAANGIQWRYGSWFLAVALYVPPAIMILRMPNQGMLPPLIERLADRLAITRRGTARSKAGEFQP